MGNDNKENRSLLNNTHKDAIQLYESWVATLNHYSGLVLTIRITAITSGMIILAAAGTLLLREENTMACQLVCCFGIAFSIVLSLIVDNYYKHYNQWLEFVVDAESKMSLPYEMRTQTRYKKLRSDRWRPYVKIVHNGCTLLIIVAAIVILISTFFVDVNNRS